MDVDIDYLIETAQEELDKLRDSGNVNLGIVLLCALELFKKEKAKEGGDKW